jgi:uncharacterized protein DUF3631
MAKAGTGNRLSTNVELLADIKLAFGGVDAIRSDELVAKLILDPERPWTEWNNGKPLTQKSLAGLLGPFGIISETVHPADRPHGRGYKRVRFEEAWEAYLPGQNSGQNPFSQQSEPSEVCKRASAEKRALLAIFEACKKRIRTLRKRQTYPITMQVCTPAHFESRKLTRKTN